MHDIRFCAFAAVLFKKWYESCYCVLQGLAPLHNCGMSHGDLTPANILVYNWDKLEEMNVVIVDLGSSVAPSTCE